MMDQAVQLTLPADAAFAPVAALTVSGVGMMAGLDIDLLGDLRMVATECLDCLLHQAGKPESIRITTKMCQQRLCIRFEALDRVRTQEKSALCNEIAQGVLETLMPQVQLLSDEDGVHGIECSMPV